MSKKFDFKKLTGQINPFLTKIAEKSKIFGKKVLKGLGTVGSFLLAVILVFCDKLKELYGKLPDKFKIFGKIGGKDSRTNKNISQTSRKGIFAGLSEKDYAKLWAIVGVFCVILFAIVIVVLSVSKPKIQKPMQITSAESTEPANTVTISFGGSIVLQDSLLNSCKTEMGDYEIYDGLKYLNRCFNSDINVVSVIGAINEGNSAVSGFPKTNYPINLIRALRSIHVNMAALASDHSFDAGVAGVASTIAACEEQQITPLGLYKDANDYIDPHITEINGIKIGFVNASGFTDDDYYTLTEEEKQNKIKHFNSTSAPSAVRVLLEEIQVLKNSQVDVIIAILRWGKPETTYPEAYTREIADTLVKNGVDIIVGYGSNYLQKLTFKEFEQVDGTKKDCLIMYDLGNLYSDNSGASERISIPQDNLIVNVEISLPANGGKAVISKAGYTPLYVSQKQANDISDRADFVVIPSGKYGSMDEMPDIFSTQEQWNWCKNSFERVQLNMASWVGQKMILSMIPEDEPVSSAELQNAV